MLAPQSSTQLAHSKSRIADLVRALRIRRLIGRQPKSRVKSPNALARGSEQMRKKSSRLSPHHRYVIALHSPRALAATGLRMCPPEKGPQIDALRSRAVRSLRFTLLTKYCEIRACFAYFAATGGASSLQFRLAGGARSLALTLLRLNSLLTGKNTGNLRISALENAHFSL
jgi:hypothetical protein